MNQLYLFGALTIIRIIGIDAVNARKLLYLDNSEEERSGGGCGKPIQNVKARISLTPPARTSGIKHKTI